MNTITRILLITLVAVSAARAAEASAAWISYGDWQPVGLATSYYTVEHDADGASLWFNAHFQGHDSVIHLRGADLSSLERVLPRFDAQIIHGYDQDLGDRATPIISRSAALRLADGSVLVQASIGPAYDGGRSELYPVLFHSPDGVDKWRYLGPPSGEPAAWLDQQRQAGARIRCEGGGIVQLADGRLRLYQQNLGASLAIIEADSVEGPWHFVRHEDGSIRNAVAGLDGGWLFPQVIAVGEHGYLLSAGDAWPPRAIRGAISGDGLNFSWVGDNDAARIILQPHQVLAEATSVKAVRFAWDAQQQRLLAVANPFHQRQYPLLWSWATIDLKIFAP